MQERRCQPIGPRVARFRAPRPGVARREASAAPSGRQSRLLPLDSRAEPLVWRAGSLLFFVCHPSARLFAARKHSIGVSDELMKMMNLAARARSFVWRGGGHSSAAIKREGAVNRISNNDGR